MNELIEKKEQQVPGVDELISLAEAVALSGLSPSQLRLLAVRGTIWSKKLGRNWFTTAQAINKYLRQERKPGPNPKTLKNDTKLT